MEKNFFKKIKESNGILFCGERVGIRDVKVMLFFRSHSLSLSVYLFCLFLGESVARARHKNTLAHAIRSFSRLLASPPFLPTAQGKSEKNTPFPFRIKDYIYITEKSQRFGFFSLKHPQII